MKLVFGDLTLKAAAAADAKDAADLENRISRAIRQIRLYPGATDRDLVSRFGRDAVDKARHRLRAL